MLLFDLDASDYMDTSMIVNMVNHHDLRINKVESQLSSLTSMLNALINNMNTANKRMENMSKAIQSNQKRILNINIKVSIVISTLCSI